MPNYRPQEKTKLNLVTVKTVIFLIIAILFALLPLSHNFISNSVDYETKETFIELKEGINEIDNVSIVLNKGKVTNVIKTEKSVINKVFGFSNFRKFVFMASPFLSLLFLTVFLGYVLLQVKDKKLKKLGKLIFNFYLFTALFYLLWIFIPNNDLSPIYYRIYIAIGALLLWGMVFFSYKYFLSKQTRVSILINHILKTRFETVYPLAETEDKERKAQLVKENDRRIVATIKKVKPHV